MTAIRRTALTLVLALAAVLGSAGATSSALASFSDSASRSTTITTTTVDAPTNFTGSATCTATTGTMAASWTRSTTPRISGYTVTVYFSDGFVQTVELPPTASSWSASIAPYYITAFTVQYKITTHTDYGWFKDSARTAQLKC